MLARMLSAALIGVEAVIVRVEVDVVSGLPAFTMVGLPDSAVLGLVGEFAYRGDDGLDRVEHDFLVRVDGDLRHPRLEPGKHTEGRWIGEADLDLLDKDQAPGDLLTRRIVAAGLAVARGLGLILDC